MAVDDAGRGREDRPGTAQGRLHGLRFRRAEPAQIVDAVLPGTLEQPLQGGDLGVFGRDQQLADLRMRNETAAAEGIEPAPTLDAEDRLQRAGRIIDSGMDHFGIAGAGDGAHRGLGFQHQHLAAGPGEAAPDGEPQYAGPDNSHIDGFAPAA